MKIFNEIQPTEIGENTFHLIGKDWMLITATDKNGKTNTMTASWGFFGVLWNLPVSVCFIRPQRYTFNFVEEAEHISLSFLGEEHRDALKLCGTKSGRDIDKISEAGLTLRYDENKIPYFDEAKMVILGKKLYTDMIKKDGFINKELLKNYPIDDFHKVYICEIEKVLEQKK